MKGGKCPEELEPRRVRLPAVELLARPAPTAIIRLGRARRIGLAGGPFDRSSRAGTRGARVREPPMRRKRVRTARIVDRSPLQGRNPS
ncbi:MAG TPA: hypothetical protein DCQ98_12430 [Planctomycetaceae bacterium]|nr:hypothetical protein [Planctomycetaceae bacterium]